MAKFVPSALILCILQLTLASASCVSNSGPSPYEYDIDKQFTNRQNENNLVAGWRQYEDRLIYKNNFTVPASDSEIEYKDVFEYPLEGVEGTATITHVISLDLYNTLNRGAVAYIVKGGIGFKNVAVGYTYDPEYGIDHWVEIYGHFEQESKC